MKLTGVLMYDIQIDVASEEAQKALEAKIVETVKAIPGVTEVEQVDSGVVNVDDGPDTDDIDE